MQISEQSLKDLEYFQILQVWSEFGLLQSTRDKILDHLPNLTFEEMKLSLKETSEFQSSFESHNAIPYTMHYDLPERFGKIHIENYYLQSEDFLHIRSNALQIKEIIPFFEKFEDYFPTLKLRVDHLVFENQIVKLINEVFDKHGEMKSSASADLKQIRRQQKLLTSRITSAFNKSLSQYSEYLDEIRESVVDNIRVLAVKNMHRKKVKGRVLGHSKTGSIAYMQPEKVILSQNELNAQRELERQEIIRILRELTSRIGEYAPFITKYQNLLDAFDLIQAKARFALECKANLPKLVNAPKMNLLKAYHPLLFLSNKERKLETIPQDLDLDDGQRLVVISGPNAGGKSITLKTVGLLQLMIQSGLLVPVHPKSQMGYFGAVLTDIGDNQSIQNQLSTYSYRLKQMRNFLKKTNPETLLLIDEFGTGSDPDLGGALAEVFMEEFYEKEATGIFTTHYTNIKLLAERLPQATNACMLFDEKSLEPLYKLELGQAGSSFTFEVAIKNKIPYSLINRAKKKVEKDKVRLDKTILKLQQEKFTIQKEKSAIADLKQDSAKKQVEITETEEKLKDKLFQFQQFYEKEQKMVAVGRKIKDWANQYKQNRNKKQLIGKFMKWVEMDIAQKSNTKEAKNERKVASLVKKGISKQADKLDELKKEKVIKEKKEVKKRVAELKIGDRVKLKDSSSVGVVERIENKSIDVNYGKFRAKISIFDAIKV